MAFPAHAEKRVALVIGNSAYKLISPLENPRNDAAVMASTLKELGFNVVEAKNADRKGMARAIKDFGKRLRRAGPQSVGLFFYAGHGVQAGGSNFLIPLGAPIQDEEDLEIQAVSASWVLRQMKLAKNALNIVIMDACRNNPFRGIFRSATRGLARMNAPSGSLIAYAAAPGQLAADGKGANSPYTAALVAAMRKQGLPLEQVFKRERVAVEKATGNQQTPWEESSLKGDFYFRSKVAPKPAPFVSPAPATSGLTPEMLFWQSIQDSQRPEEFEAYLKTYPSGIFTPLARLRLENLKVQKSTSVAPTSKDNTQAVSQANFSGIWETSYGRMVLSQQGNQVMGLYKNNGGKIVGNVVGNKLQGQWQETLLRQETLLNLSSSGEMEFLMSEDGRSFSGQWRNFDSSDWTNWTGSRL